MDRYILETERASANSTITLIWIQLHCDISENRKRDSFGETQSPKMKVEGVKEVFQITYGAQDRAHNRSRTYVKISN